MKKIMLGRETESTVTGIIQKGNVLDHEEGIYGYLLTEEEAEGTCHYSGRGHMCSTCKGNDCQYFEERVNGIVVCDDDDYDEPIRETTTPCDYGECPYDAEYSDACRYYCGLGVDESEMEE